MKTRFIHSSDWQLGMTRAFLGEEAAPRFAQARIDAIARLGELASEHRAEFIVVAGDVFESNQLSPQTLGRTREALEDLPVPVFLLPGNHDPLDASSILTSPEYRDSERLRVIRDRRPQPVPGLPGVEVVGAPWHSKHPGRDLCAELLGELSPAAGVRIAVCHGQVDSMSPDTTRPETIALATAEAALANGIIHYLALGDRHSLTQVGNSGRIWFSGAPVATDFDETDPNRALLVELDGDGCQTTPLAVGDWHFIAHQHQLDNAADLAGIREWLAALPAKERSVLKLGFTGTVNLATAAALDTLLESQGSLFASLRRRERTTELVVLPDELDREGIDLTGYARSAWEELLEQAPADAEAQAALRLLYRISGQGKGG